MTDKKKSHGRSKTGIELTDEVLDRMADEAEAGLDITKLRRRPGRPAMGSGPAETLPVRLDPELRDSTIGLPPSTRPHQRLFAKLSAATSR